ncbi:hypothetical protein GCM10027187_63690 [Streptosporangium sandarakinum]
MRSLALLAVLAAGATLAAAPAAAAVTRTLHAPDPRCPDDAVCFWTEPGFDGERQVVRPVPGSRPCTPTPRTHAESAVNNTRFSRLLYLDSDCADRPVVHPGRREQALPRSPHRRLAVTHRPATGLDTVWRRASRGHHTLKSAAATPHTTRWDWYRCG